MRFEYCVPVPKCNIHFNSNAISKIEAYRVAADVAPRYLYRYDYAYYRLYKLTITNPVLP
jgi:hypothetical protein